MSLCLTFSWNQVPTTSLLLSGLRAAPLAIAWEGGSGETTGSLSSSGEAEEEGTCQQLFLKKPCSVISSYPLGFYNHLCCIWSGTDSQDPGFWLRPLEGQLGCPVTSWNDWAVVSCGLEGTVDSWLRQRGNSSWQTRLPVSGSAGGGSVPPKPDPGRARERAGESHWTLLTSGPVAGGGPVSPQAEQTQIK